MIACQSLTFCRIIASLSCHRYTAGYPFHNAASQRHMGVVRKLVELGMKQHVWQQDPPGRMHCTHLDEAKSVAQEEFRRNNDGVLVEMPHSHPSVTVDWYPL